MLERIFHSATVILEIDPYDLAWPPQSLMDLGQKGIRIFFPLKQEKRPHWIDFRLGLILSTTKLQKKIYIL